jgi:exopolyphosphatase/guanosine-5'-triphosphate,3'-diphosphate pyrophosphatase
MIPAVSWRTSRASDQIHSTHRQVAVVDLGSNSWRLVVFTYGAEGDWFKRTDELFETVRIVQGASAAGTLTEEAIARGLETLVVFERYCRAHGLLGEAVLPIATSAIRDAANRELFLARAHEATGLVVEVLSAEEEARYGYVAAVNTTTLGDGAVVELGGGSMQLVGVAERRARQLRSFALGAVRLTERLLAGPGPHRRRELERVRAHVRDALAGERWLAESGPRLVGVGGAVRNLAAAAQRAARLPDVGIQGFVLTRAALGELVRELAALPVAQRGALPGIKPGRGDIILAAALTLQVVLELGGFGGLEVTEAGLREGVFLARRLLAGREPLLADVRAAAVRNLAIQYESDMPHVEHVAKLAVQLHESMRRAGLFTAVEGEQELLWAAAMLHDVGMTISYDDHHKHSRYLIVSAELPGFDPRERALIAQMTRYHRKGTPKLGELAALARAGDEQLLARCSTLLRLAEHLERGRDQSVDDACLTPSGEGVDLRLHARGDLTLPRWSVERYGDDLAFERVFGRRLAIG